MLPRCSQLKVAGPLQTQDIWALKHIFILFLRKVYGTESLRRAGEDGPRVKEITGENGRRSQVNQKRLQNQFFSGSVCGLSHVPGQTALRFSGPGLPRPSPPPLQIIQRQPQRDSPSWGDRQLRYEGTAKSSSLNSSRTPDISTQE